MNISELNRYYSYLTSNWSVTGTSSTQSTAAELLSALDGDNTSGGSSSGDSAELSLAGVMMAGGMQPMMAGGPPDDGFKELVDKVADGTATDEELEEFITKLKEMAAERQSQLAGGQMSTSSDSEMEVLMAKILDGTATDGDVQAIAAKMQEKDDQQAARSDTISVNSGNTYSLPRGY